MSSSNSAIVPAQKATHIQGGTANGGTAVELAALAAASSTIESPDNNLQSKNRSFRPISPLRDVQS
jgi:hypothetical protein